MSKMPEFLSAANRPVFDESALGTHHHVVIHIDKEYECSPAIVMTEEEWDWQWMPQFADKTLRCPVCIQEVWYHEENAEAWYNKNI